MKGIASRDLVLKEDMVKVAQWSHGECPLQCMCRCRKEDKSVGESIGVCM